MAGSCWRLLAAVSLIFFVDISLCGQDAAAAREILEPNLYLWKYGPGIAPGRSAAPVLPGRYPVIPYPPNPLTPAATVQPLILQQLVRGAGIIFSGHVTFVGHASPSSGQNSASTTITFQVEHAIRGSAPGQSLTIHEWAGLWAGGERYRLGERVLLFLYPPSKLGLTSPVSGATGRFSMNSQGNVVLSELQISNLAAHPILGGKILGGKTIVPYSDFALAVHRSAEGR
jgi:hypothetical protein